MEKGQIEYPRKKISKSFVWQAADTWSILTGHFFILYWPRVSAAKKINGMIGLKIVAPGKSIDKAKDYGELTHREALDAMDKYAHSLPPNNKANLTSDKLKEVVNNCSHYLLAKLIFEVGQEFCLARRNGGFLQLDECRVHVSAAAEAKKLHDSYMASGKMINPSYAKAMLLALFPVVKQAALRHKRNGKRLIPDKYHVIV